jgi:hypothetical protein
MQNLSTSNYSYSHFSELQARRLCSLPNSSSRTSVIRESTYLYQSPLKQHGGFAVFAGLLSLDLHQAMLHEAQSLLPYAQASKVIEPDLEEVRGGSPPRSFLSVPAGSAQCSLYHSPDLKNFLEQVTGLSIHLSGIQGTYSFYARRGDYLSLHRDIEACDLAVITCLQDYSPNYTRGGVLCLYPNRCEEPLSQIRATPNQGCIPVYLDPNMITPIVNLQVRIVSILCFSVENKPIRIRKF